MKKTALVFALVMVMMLTSCVYTTEETTSLTTTEVTTTEVTTTEVTTTETTTTAQATTDTTTNEVTDTTIIDTTTNIVIEAPVISITDNQINWDMISQISEYEVRAKDVTETSPENRLEDQMVSVYTNSFLLSNLMPNHTYEISVGSVQGMEHSDYSNTVTVDYFLPSDTSYELTYNLNSTNDFVWYDDVLPEIYFIKQNDEIATDENYQFDHDLLVIDQTYMKLFTQSVSLELYSADGIIDVNIYFTSVDKPSILSGNSVPFKGEDVIMVFDLCGGEFVEINGNDLTEDDYTLTGNVLIINADFFQTLFDANAERNSVILSYQLRNDDQVVIGYLFINRNS